MNHYRNLILCTILFLGGCVTRPEYKDNELSVWPNFSVQGKMGARKNYVRQDGSIAWINYDDNHAKRGSGDLLIEIYPKEENCNGNLLGVWEPKSWTNGIHAIWGKVDYFNGEIPDYEEEPLCRPISGGAGYGFCAQKGDTSVVICVAQVTDNEKQAEEIFKTFKWTE